MTQKQKQSNREKAKKVAIQYMIDRAARKRGK